MIAARAAGRVSDGDLGRYIRRRDRDGLLEADASTVHTGWIDLLPALYPAARYLLTIRNCYTWLDAALNQLLEAAPERETRRRLASLVLPGGGPTLLEVFQSPASLIRHFPKVADYYLGDWASGNERLLAHIPDARLMIVTIDDVLDMERRIPELARFLDVPSRTLTREYGRATDAPVRHGVLGRVDARLLRACVDRRCGALMGRFFPGYTLGDFLARQ
jgi:hypothetical protein